MVLCRNVYHWTKVVLIERQKQSVVPDVTIEKRKCLAPAPSGSSGGGGKNNNGDFDDVENHESEYLFLQPDRKWEFNRAHLHLKSDLGQGEFGKVVLGTVSAPLPNNTEHALIDVRGTVAVKMLKDGHSDQGRRSTQCLCIRQISNGSLDGPKHMLIFATL